MRIPSEYLDYLIKKKKIQQDISQEQQDLATVEAILNAKAAILENQNQLVLSHVLDLLDQALEAIIQRFQNSSFQLPSIFTTDGSEPNVVQVCDDIIAFYQGAFESTRMRELFLSYDRILDIILYHPEYSLKRIERLLSLVQQYLINLNGAKTQKFKVEFMGYELVRLHHIMLYFTWGVSSLSEYIEYAEYTELPRRSLNFSLPNQYLCDYKNLSSMINLSKVIKEPLTQYSYDTFDFEGQTPYTLASEMLLGANTNCPFFDRLLVRLICEFALQNQRDAASLQQLVMVQTYNYFILIQSSEQVILIPQMILIELQSQMIDQKDYMIQVLRLLNHPKEFPEELHQPLMNALCQPIELFSSKQQVILSDPQFNDKIQQFTLAVLQDLILGYGKQLKNLSNPLPYDNSQIANVVKRIGSNIKIQEIFFNLLQENGSAFRSFFKRSPQYTQYCNLIIDIINNLEKENPIMPFELARSLATFLANMIQDCPIQSPTQFMNANQLDNQLESNILNSLVQLAKRLCVVDELADALFSQIHKVMKHFKVEYDQVNIANAQSEHMQPLPERFHRFLNKMWDEGLLSEALNLIVTGRYEQLSLTLIQLYVVVLGESPMRVRLLFESGDLKRIIEKISRLLTEVERSSDLLTATLNFLVAINTHEQAASLALSQEEGRDGLVKQVFDKCYLPCDGDSEVQVSEEFGKRIIQLYSSSQLAKKQIEKVIETTFMTLSQLVDLGQEKIEEIVSQKDRLKQFYTYSKSLQAVLLLFEKQHVEKKSYRAYQGLEEMQLQELYNMKDQLFNQLLKNNKFVEALERIIMSPILIGSKSKDQFVEHYVSVLCKKGKLVPFTSLFKELKMIEENYMVVQGKKTIDMNQLIDYEALSVYMSRRYFFRKIIKHISPQTYRGFYILSRFHLIHYLARMCKSQGLPSTFSKQNITVLIQHLLEIYFLSSQHAAFHESVMFQNTAKSIIKKGSIAQYDEEQQIKRKISVDKFIPIQSSCLDLIAYLHQQQLVQPDQRSIIADHHSQIVCYFLASIDQERQRIQELPMGLQLLTSVTIAQDLMKSLCVLICRFIQVPQYVPAQFYNVLDENQTLLMNSIGTIIKAVDDRVVKNISPKQKEAYIVSKFIPYFRDAILNQGEGLTRQIFLKKVSLERVTIGSVVLKNQQQVDIVMTEIYFRQWNMIKQLLDMACHFKLIHPSQEKQDNKQKNVLIEALTEKYYNIKEIANPDMRQSSGAEKGADLALQYTQLLQEQKLKTQQAKRPSLFDRPDIQQVLEMVVSMGFSEKIAKKAIRRIEVPEPTMILDFILQGKVSDDEDEEEPKDEADELEKEKETIEKLQKQIPQQQQQQEQQLLEEDQFKQLMAERFPGVDYTIPVSERLNQIQEEQKQHMEVLLQSMLSQSYEQLALQPLNNYSPQQQTVEMLLRYGSKEQYQDILKQAFAVLFPTETSKVPLKQLFPQYAMAFGQLSLIKRIYATVYKKMYSYQWLVEQTEEQPYSLSLLKIIKIGRKLIDHIKNGLIPEVLKEQKSLKELENEQPQSQTITELCEPVNELLEMKSIVIEALFQEYNEASTQLTQFTLSGTHNNEQILEKHWEIVRHSLDFLKDFLRVENELGSIIADTFHILADMERTANKDNQQSSYLAFASKRHMLDKNVLRQILIQINDFGLHNQAQLYSFLNDPDLIATLLELKVQWQAYDVDENQINLLENLLALVAYDRETVTQIVKQAIKQVILMDHSESKASDLLKKQQGSLQFQSTIEVPLYKVINSLPPLVNNPLFLQIVTESPEFKVYKSQQTLPPIPPPLKEPSSAPQQPALASQGFSTQYFKEKERDRGEKGERGERPPITPKQLPIAENVLIRWDITKDDAEVTLNSNYLTLVQRLCQQMIVSFNKSLGHIVQYVDGGKSLNPAQRVRAYGYTYTWQNILKTLEYLIPKVPQTVFFLRELRLKDLGITDKDMSMIDYLLKYALWVAPERLNTFFNAYLSEAGHINQANCHQMAAEILDNILNTIEFTNPDIIKRYHLFQGLTLLTQLLCQQEVCLLLSNTKSKYNIVPRIIDAIKSVPDSNLQVYKFFTCSLLKSLEPFLQAQVYHNHLREGEIGRVPFTRDQTEYHYYHYVRCAVLHAISNRPGMNSELQSLVNQYTSPLVQTTLKADEQTLEQWPPNLSKRIQGQQQRGAQRNQDDDASESESDQDMPEMSQRSGDPAMRWVPPSFPFGSSYSQYGQLFSSQWQSDPSSEQIDYIRREEDKAKIEPSMWIHMGVKISLTPDEQDLPCNFKLPAVIIKSDPKYNCPDTNQLKQLRDWEYVMAGLYNYIFEKIEKKKTLHQRSMETQIKISVEQLQIVIRILTNRIPVQDEAKIYLNGSVPEVLSYNYSLLFMGLRQPNPQRQQHQYQQISVGTVPIGQLQLLNTIGFTYLNNSLIYRQMPSDISDASVTCAKIISIIEAEGYGTPDAIQPLQPHSPTFTGVTQSENQSITENDKVILEVFERNLVLQDQHVRLSYFTSYPFETLRFLVKSPKLSNSLFEMIINNLKKKDTQVQIKGLYLLLYKWQQPGLSSLYKRFVEQSPKIQESTEEFTQIDENNPFVYLLKLLAQFAQEQRIGDIEILTTPLLRNNTVSHQNYIVTIIKQMLSQAQEPPHQSIYSMLKSEPNDDPFKLRSQKNLSGFPPPPQMSALQPKIHGDKKLHEIIAQEEFSSNHHHFEMMRQQLLETRERIESQRASELEVLEEAQLQHIGFPMRFQLDQQPAPSDPFSVSLAHSLANFQDIQYIKQQFSQFGAGFQHAKQSQPLPPKLSTDSSLTQFEYDLLYQLCHTITHTGLRESNSADLISSLNLLAQDKIKITQTINIISQILADQAVTVNQELDKSRESLIAKSQIVDELDTRLPEATVIQRLFNCLMIFFNASIKEHSKVPQRSQNAPSTSQSTRQQIMADKKKHRNNQNKKGEKQQSQPQPQQQQKPLPNIFDEERMQSRDIKALFTHILQKPQTYELWLRTIETLVLLKEYHQSKSLESILKKLNPLLECFLNVYRCLWDDQDKMEHDAEFFERYLSGSGLGSAKRDLPTHLQRTFSAVRDNQMQLDDQFQFICFKGKGVINALMAKKLQQIQQDLRAPNSYSQLKQFRDNEALGFVFHKMSKLVSFENKKMYFEMNLDQLRLSERSSSRSRPQKPETLDLTIARDQRLKASMERLQGIEPAKFRKSEIKIKYVGEKGQDEGGLRREWYTNIIKDILETGFFILTPSRQYRLAPNQTDVAIYKFLGRVLAKAMYDGQLVPAYLISPIFKAILSIKLNFSDLKFFNEGFYESYQKFVDENVSVSYSDLIECWIPDGYISILDENKIAFSAIIQEHLQSTQRKDSEQVQEEEVVSQPPSKKQSLDITAPEDQADLLEQRNKKRQNRKKQKAQQQQTLTQEVLNTINLTELLAGNQQQVPIKIRKTLCISLHKKITQDEIQAQVNAIKEGFFEVLSRDLFNYMEGKDLERLIMGVPFIDIDDLQQHTEYVNYTVDSEIVQWFWEILKEMSDQDKADFLMFATGSPLMPFGGFKNLKGQNGFKKFTIVQDAHPDHLVKAHTCFYRIELPKYPSKDVMREKLHKSFKESGSEFSLS